VVGVAVVSHAARSPWLPRLAGAAVDVAGKVTGRLLAVLPTIPGFAGAAMVSYGAATIYRPAGVIAGGLFLLLLDRRIP
jgi:hypothetical protein